MYHWKGSRKCGYCIMIFLPILLVMSCGIWTANTHVDE
jgi:hypothetical protein